ncbi:MAG: mersacidin/lichenicidin family type 2 lantibiotic [Acidobacteriota bacterium]
MDVSTQIRAWKDPKFRSTLDAHLLAPHPAGERLVETNEAELAGLFAGGLQDDEIEITPSEGHVCSISGECSNGPVDCWPV